MAELMVQSEFGEFKEKNRITQRLHELEMTLQLAVEFVELLSQDRSPIMDSVSTTTLAL